MKNLFFAIFITAILSSCTFKDEPVVEEIYYSNLKFDPEQDSLFLNANNEARQLVLSGLIVNTTTTTITNTGLITDARYTIVTSDTTYVGVDGTKAQWVSSNSAVATVSNGGQVVGKSAGVAQITARVGKTLTKPLVVSVRAVNTAPGLSLNPPSVIFIMENFTTVSGTVQTNAIVSVTESNSSFFKDSAAYNSVGAFNVAVTGLQQGVRSITVRARNAADVTKYTERTKGVIYWAPNSPEANSIVGNWLGTTLGKNFNFSISHSVIPTRYDISGKMDIQFEGVGLVRDIDLIGVLNNNGTINVALSKSYQDFTISGKFNGYFKSTGMGEGEYSAQAVKSGWPKISFNDKWTAVKLP